jgi:hypothetical protein
MNSALRGGVGEILPQIRLIRAAFVEQEYVDLFLRRLNPQHLDQLRLQLRQAVQQAVMRSQWEIRMDRELSDPILVRPLSRVQRLVAPNSGVHQRNEQQDTSLRRGRDHAISPGASEGIRPLVPV